MAEPQAHLVPQQSRPCALSALTYRSFILWPPRRSALRHSALPDIAARDTAAPARSRAQAPVPGEGAGARGGSARRRPGPAAAGSRQIRVSWRGLTCEPARAAGPSRGAAPARPAALPPPRSPPRRRPENGERGRRGGAGEGAGRRQPRACGDNPQTLRPPGAARAGERRPSPGGGGLQGNFKPVEVQKRPRRGALRRVPGKVNTGRDGASPIAIRQLSFSSRPE